MLEIVDDTANAFRILLTINTIVNANTKTDNETHSTNTFTKKSNIIYNMRLKYIMKKGDCL